MTNLNLTGRQSLVLDLELDILAFKKRWAPFIKLTTLDRVEELKQLCEQHKDNPKVLEIMPFIDERLSSLEE
jgi:hypothetical protein